MNGTFDTTIFISERVLNEIYFNLGNRVLTERKFSISDSKKVENLKRQNDCKEQVSKGWISCVWRQKVGKRKWGWTVIYRCQADHNNWPDQSRLTRVHLERWSRDSSGRECRTQFDGSHGTRHSCTPRNASRCSPPMISSYSMHAHVWSHTRACKHTDPYQNCHITHIWTFYGKLLLSG